jgi:outer membrane lipoprotein-sorting protein
LHRTLAAAGSLLLALLAASTPAARAENAPVPAITAFDQAFAATNDYHCIIHVHEVKGDQSQNRVYEYWFMKPHFIKTLIQSGDGKGSGGVWNGGDQVSGHQGGLFSGIHLKISLTDPRAVSLRGITMPEGLLQNVVHMYVKTPGTLTQANGGKIDGVPTDRIDLKVANPSANSGISEQILYFSQASHWPVRQVLYSGNTIVLDQIIDDLKTNVGLTQSDFPF